MKTLRDNFAEVMEQNRIAADLRNALPGAKGAYAALNSTWAEREAEVQMQRDEQR